MAYGKRIRGEHYVIRGRDAVEIFDVKGAKFMGTWYLNDLDGSAPPSEPAYPMGEIISVIREDLDNGQRPQHLVVDPRTAVLMYLCGDIRHDHLAQSDPTAKSIVIKDFAVKVDEIEYKVELRIFNDAMHSVSTDYSII